MILEYAEAEKQRIRREAIRNIAIFIGVKVAIAAAIYYAAKKARELA